MSRKALFLAALPVALIASCSSSLFVGTAEAIIGPSPGSSLIVKNALAVLGLAFSATIIAFPAVLVALWILIVPATMALGRVVKSIWGRDIALLGLGIALGLPIMWIMGLDLGLHTDSFLGAIYGLAACFFWVLALHKLPSLRPYAQPANG